MFCLKYAGKKLVIIMEMKTNCLGCRNRTHNIGSKKNNYYK